MILAILVATMVAAFVGLPLVPVLVVGALAQACAAFVVTRSQSCVLLGSALLLAAGARLASAMLLGPHAAIGAPVSSRLLELDAVVCIAAVLGLLGATIIGLVGPGAQARRRAGAGAQAEPPAGAGARPWAASPRDGQDSRGIAAPVQQITTRPVATSSAPSAGVNTSDDLGLSMAVSASTGSTVLGYAVGGSLVGAALGAALHRPAADRPADRLDSDARCSDDAREGASTPDTGSWDAGGSSSSDSGSCSSDSGSGSD